MPRSRHTDPLVTLGNMRQNGARLIAVYCWVCRHEAILSGDHWPDHLSMTLFGPRMVCPGCGIFGNADMRPDWKERRFGENLTGTQWQ